MLLKLLVQDVAEQGTASPGKLRSDLVRPARVQHQLMLVGLLPAPLQRRGFCQTDGLHLHQRSAYECLTCSYTGHTTLQSITCQWHVQASEYAGGDGGGGLICNCCDAVKWRTGENLAIGFAVPCPIRTSCQCGGTRQGSQHAAQRTCVTVSCARTAPAMPLLPTCVCRGPFPPPWSMSSQSSYVPSGAGAADSAR